MIFGFLLHSILTSKYLEKDNPIKKLFSKFYKTLLFTGLAGFCITAFFFSPYFDFINDDSITFRDPIKLAAFYPIDNEGLTSNSVVVTMGGSRAVDYGVIPFNPFLGFPPWDDFNPDLVRSESIALLINTMNQGYEVFAFKEPSNHLEKPFFNYLVEKHNFVLRDYSNSFCKLEFFGNEINHDALNFQSDEECL